MHNPHIMPATPSVRLVTLTQLMPNGDWQLGLAHDRPEHLFIWMTRGQGLALIGGARRGIGTHNALFLPARSLFALEPGRQSFGQALIVPPAARLDLPDRVQHLRIRDVVAQKELQGHVEALGREQIAALPDYQDAMTCQRPLRDCAIW